MNKDQKLNVGFITTVSGRWPRELPQERHDAYAKWFNEAYDRVNLVHSPSIAVDKSDVDKHIKLFKESEVDLVVLLIGAFTGDAVACAMAEEVGVPVVLWALPEPPFNGGRIMSNALVAATMNTAALKRLELPFHFVFGGTDDERVTSELDQIVAGHYTIKRMNNTFLGILGYRPTAFYSSTFDETLIRQVFGVKMEAFDLVYAFDKAEQVNDEIVAAEVAKLQAESTIDNLPDGYLENHARLYLGIKAVIDEQGFDAASLRCWPELGFKQCTPCAIISRFADEGYVMGCESDIDATLTMIMQNYLTDDIVFMSDLIHIDEEANTGLLWHCGQASKKLHHACSEPTLTNHSLAGEGVVLEGTLKEGPVTVARVYKDGDGYKMFLAGGEAVRTEKVVRGAMVNVKFNTPIRDVIYTIAEEGIAHHYSTVWHDVRNEMRMIADLLGIEVIEV